tara:strand:- start:542 stop:1102 length:561 start_codon:yes stop_codon:yes gene_type:complete
MNLDRFFRRAAPVIMPVDALYDALVKKSRETAFYATFGVPDTVNGRFDMIIIHAMLVFRRLRDGGVDAEVMGQAVFDLMFKDMDRSLREMGVGDLSVSKHIKKMAKAFYGRATIYEQGLDGEAEALGQALQANVYRHQEASSDVIAGMTNYLRRMDAHIAGQAVADIVAGHIDLTIPVAGAGHGPA